MNFAVNGGAQQEGFTHAACLQTVDVRDRVAYGPADFVAPWATTCLLVHPSPMTETYLGLFETGCYTHPGRAVAYHADHFPELNRCTGAHQYRALREQQIENPRPRGRTQRKTTGCIWNGVYFTWPRRLPRQTNRPRL